MTPVAPPEVKGRAFDFPYGVNMSSGPRAEAGQNNISFQALRRLADPAQGGLDLLRLAIETRKNQMAAQPWRIVGRAKNDDGGPRARALELALRKPDGVSTFRAWTRKLLEDHYVIDAPTVYYGASKPDRPMLEVVDGATIKRLVDDGGRTPLPPLPAYQQQLHGMPAVDYRIDELGYYPYNERSYKFYGMSHVEQVLGIVTIALNRQLSVLSYYTDGTVPDAFMSVPETWSPEVIAQYQLYLDSVLSGQQGERRKLRLVPGGSVITFAKEELLKNEFDEWLARIVCFCFSLPPSALVKQVNRATASTAKDAAQEEGLEPEKIWLKDLMDDALERQGAADLEWQWQDEEIVDPIAKAGVIAVYVGNKPIMTIQQARDMAGLPPATPEELDELKAAGAPPPMVGPLAGADKEDGAEPVSSGGAAKLGKRTRGGRALQPLRRNRALLVSTADTVHGLAQAVLADQRAAVVAAVRGPDKLAKAVTVQDINRALDALHDAPWAADIRAQLQAALAALASDRSAAAMAQLESLVEEAQFAALLGQANTDAIAWAEARVGNLVTDVTATTRQAINDLTARAVEGGWTNTELANQLEDAYGFSSDRALMIARTETAEAETQGTLAGYRASGVVTGKGWSTDPEACDECAPLDGAEVLLDEDFPDDGGDGPPLHPNCECVVYAVVDDGGGEEE